MEKNNYISVDGVEIELRMDASLAPIALRAFAGVTLLDAEVDALPIPARPLWLRTFVRLLRWYRRLRPLHVGHRCVFDPSCSRYSELAFRRRGLLKGGLATLSRLQRCKPGSGGVDVP